MASRITSVQQLVSLLTPRMPALPAVSGGEAESHPTTSKDVDTVYVNFGDSTQRRDALQDRFDNHFNLPLQDHAAEHQIYMETTVKDFQNKISHLERLLRSEKARRSQIGMTFRSFFKDTMLEIQQYGAEQRAITNARITERFDETKRRLEELALRIPREQQEMLDEITTNTEAIRKQVDHFLSVDCANESVGCKARHQALVDAIGTGAMHVEDEMNVAMRQRQNSMDELRDRLRESSELAAKNANKLRAMLHHELAAIKNALTTEALMRELSDTQLASMMGRQVGLLMQSAKCVNSTLGVEEVEAEDYASEKTLVERAARLEARLRAQLEREREAAEEAACAASEGGPASVGSRLGTTRSNMKSARSNSSQQSRPASQGGAA